MGFEVNSQLLAVKAHYFFYFAGMMSVYPYVPVYIKQLGVSESVVGLMFAVFMASSVASRTLLGALADKLQRKKVILFICIVGTAVSYIGVMFLRPIHVDAKVEVHCDNGSKVTSCHNQNMCIVGQAIKRHNSTRCTFTCEVTGIKPCSGQDPPSRLCNMTEVSIVQATLHVKDATEDAEGCVHVPAINSTWSSSEGGRLKCAAECEEAEVTHMLAGEDNAAIYRTHQFWLLALLLAINTASMGVVVNLGDTICYDILGCREEAFGRQRLWASLGCSSSILVGYLVDVVSWGQQQKDYSPCFYAMIGLLGLDMVACSKMSVPRLRDRQDGGGGGHLGKVLRRPRNVVFIACCLVAGMSTGMVWHFVLWYLEDVGDVDSCEEHDWMKLLQGLALGTQVLGDLPFYFISGWIIKRLGHTGTMTLVLVAIGLRFSLYSILTNPWLTIPIELLNGMTSSGVLIAAMTSYANLIAPNGSEATLQGLVGGVFEGIGVGSGSLIGGFLYSNYGGAMTFRMFGIAAFSLAVLHGATNRIFSPGDESCSIGSNHLMPMLG